MVSGYADRVLLEKACYSPVRCGKHGPPCRSPHERRAVSYSMLSPMHQRRQFVTPVSRHAATSSPRHAVLSGRRHTRWHCRESCRFGNRTIPASFDTLLGRPKSTSWSHRSGRSLDDSGYRIYFDDSPLFPAVEGRALLAKLIGENLPNPVIRVDTCQSTRRHRARRDVS